MVSRNDKNHNKTKIVVVIDGSKSKQCGQESVRT